MVKFDSLGQDRLFWAAHRSHVGNFVFLPLSERARQHRNSGDVPTNKEEHFRAQSPLILTFPTTKTLQCVDGNSLSRRGILFQYNIREGAYRNVMYGGILFGET